MSGTLLNQYQPDQISAPGETLLEILQDREMSPAELSARTGLSQEALQEILTGTAVISQTTAVLLEQVLGTPARFWVQREHQYREWLARQG